MIRTDLLFMTLLVTFLYWAKWEIGHWRHH